MSDSVFFWAYLGLLALLSLVALHRLALALASLRVRSVADHTPRSFPTVLVQLPLYNERYVAQRIIDAVCALDYPRDSLEIQVLDDSTDDTPQIVTRAVERWRGQGVHIDHIRRENREAFKAGALAEGLRRSQSELVAIFDADFLPAADFLTSLVSHFEDPGVGLVQARWGHLNRHESFLTETQAILLDGHFLNEHGGRFARGHFFNFNGTAGIWRRTCIVDAGGWSGATLTEDLDLSYRAQLKGWRFVYRPDVVVPAELPADTAAFKIQQHRWAKGSIETACLLLPKIFRAHTIPIRRRLEAAMHLGGNFAYPAVLVLTLMMPFAIGIRYDSDPWVSLLLDALFLAGSTGSLVLFYVLAEHRVGLSWRTLVHLPLVLAMGIGLAVNNSRAVFEAFWLKRSEFARTPKRGDSVADLFDMGAFTAAPWQALIEVAFGLYMFGAVVLAALTGRFLALPFLALFASGFLFVGLASLRRPMLLALQRALTALPRPKRIQGL